MPDTIGIMSPVRAIDRPRFMMNFFPFLSCNNPIGTDSKPYMMYPNIGRSEAMAVDILNDSLARLTIGPTESIKPIARKIK
jgi:hypothetical protein